jgi:hypothetical protein
VSSISSRRSSGSNRVDSAVEPARSKNMTVNCRRSPSGSTGAGTGANTGADVAVTRAGTAVPSAAMTAIKEWALRLGKSTSPAWFSALLTAVDRMGFAAAVWDLDSGFGITCGQPGSATLCDAYEGVFP